MATLTERNSVDTHPITMPPNRRKEPPLSVTFSNPDGLHTPLGNDVQIVTINLDTAGQLVGPGGPARQAEQCFDNFRTATGSAQQGRPNNGAGGCHPRCGCPA